MIEQAVPQLPYLSHIDEVTEASKLIAEFGEGAGFEASARASRSRNLGNHIHFCRWRQIERLILLMAADQPVGTLH